MNKLPDRYFDIEKIATGGFATIYKAIDLETGLVVALKDTTYNCSSRSATKAMQREIAILRNIRHSNIVRCYDIQRIPDESRYFIAMELCNCDLYDFIRAFRHKRRRIPESTVLTMLKDVASALTFLHNAINFTTIDSLGADDDSIRLIIHRDIKPGNIMLANDGFFKLCDFNLAREINVNSGAASNTGTIAYMAPELLNGQKYDEKVDIWSLGCTVHEMCMYYSPFHNQSMAQALNNILTGRYDSICNYYSEGLRSLVSMLLSINPADRPSAAELLGHPLLADIRKGSVEAAFLQSDAEKSTGSAKRPVSPKKSSNTDQRVQAPERTRVVTTAQSPQQKLLTQPLKRQPGTLPIDLERKVDRTQTPGRMFKQIKYPLLGNDKNVEELKIDDFYNARAISPIVGRQDPLKIKVENDELKHCRFDEQIHVNKLGVDGCHGYSYPVIPEVGTVINSHPRNTVANVGTAAKITTLLQSQVSQGEAHTPGGSTEDKGRTPPMNVGTAQAPGLLTSSAGRRATEFAVKRSQSNGQPAQAAPHPVSDTSLILAAVQNNKKNVMLNLKQAGQFNSSGMTALHVAAHHNHYGIIPLLLEKEGRMTMIRAYKYRGIRYQGLTALHIAAINGYVESVSVLAATEAKQQDALNSQTALMFCAIYNNIECARILIAYERGCRDASGRTALIHAIDSENIEHVRLLAHLENNFEDNEGKTPLTHAVANGSTDIIRVLLPLHNKVDVAKSTDIVRQLKLLPDKKLDELERYMKKYV